MLDPNLVILLMSDGTEFFVLLEVVVHDCSSHKTDVLDHDVERSLGDVSDGEGDHGKAV